MTDAAVRYANENSLTVAAWDYANLVAAVPIVAARMTYGSRSKSLISPIATSVALESTDINWDTPSVTTVAKAAAVGAGVESIANLELSTKTALTGAITGVASYGLTLGLRELLFNKAFSGTSRRKRGSKRK